MTKIDHRFIFTLLAIFLFSANFLYPDFFSDKNAFFKDFVDGDFIGLMGVIVTITIASAANTHMAIRQIEASAKKKFLSRTRKSVEKSVISLLITMLTSLAIVILKGWPEISPLWQSLINVLSVITIIFGLLVLLDLTRLAFIIEPVILED